MEDHAVEQIAVDVVSPVEIATSPVSPAEKLRTKKPTDGPALTEYNRIHQQTSRQRKADKKAIESLKYNSKLEVTKADALELLAQRIQNDHVREVAYDLALKCAAETGVFPNRFFFAHGYQKMLESQIERTEKFLEIDHAIVLDSEVIHQGDAYAIWDYSVSWREDVTFEQFLETRRKLKSSWFELGLFIGMPLEPTHAEWQA